MVPFEKLLLALLVLEALATIAVPIVYFFALRHSRDQTTNGPRLDDRSTPSGGEPP
jgi:hypothetical protein